MKGVERPIYTFCNNVSYYPVNKKIDLVKLLKLGYSRFYACSCCVYIFLFLFFNGIT